MARVTMKSIKEIGWKHIALSQKGFDGAVQVYTSAEGAEVAVAFGVRGAFLLEDENGLYSADDLVKYGVKNSDVDMNDFKGIKEAVPLVVAFEGDTTPDEDNLLKNGLTDHTADIVERAKVLNAIAESPLED